MQEPLLADRGVEGARPEGKHLRVGPEEAHQGAQADQGREPGAGRAPGVGQVHAGDADAEAVCQEARGATQARADVEHGHPGRDRRAARQHLHGREPAVVILVPGPEVLRLERSPGAPALRARGLKHLGLVDGMPVVEVDDGVRHGRTRVAHDAECTGRPP